MHKPKSKKIDYKFGADIFGCQLVFYTASGIFSPRMIDAGSLTLMRYAEIVPGNRILDLGCGYGAIGVYAAKMCKKCEIIMVDINERAVSCAKKNIIANNVKNASAKQSFGFSSLKDEFFDVIFLNPPMAAGLEECYKLIAESAEHLVPEGTLQVVCRHHKGGERIMAKMQEVFGNAEVMGRKAGYWVYLSKKESS